MSTWYLQTGSFSIKHTNTLWLTLTPSPRCGYFQHTYIILACWNRVFLKNNTKDPHPLPPRASSSLLFENALRQIQSIASNTVFGNNSCAKCLAGLEVAKFLALADPAQGPNLAVELCRRFNLASTCENTYGFLSLGSVLTQVIANADVGGFDGQVWNWIFESPDSDDLFC